MHKLCMYRTKYSVHKFTSKNKFFCRNKLIMKNGKAGGTQSKVANKTQVIAYKEHARCIKMEECK